MVVSGEDQGLGSGADNSSQAFLSCNRRGEEGSTTLGTGIVLVMSRRLTEMMGGTIGVRSTEGVGSLFWVEFSVAPMSPTLIDPSGDGLTSQRHTPSV